jgi:voltage-gated potassium channel Kch
LILGANPLARLVGRALADNGQKVAFIDANPEACRRAEEEGFKVYYGNGLDEHMLLRAHADARSAVVGLTENEGVNLLFARHVNDEFYGPRAYVALESAQEGVTADMVDTHEARLLFGGEAHLSRWAQVLSRERARTEAWVVNGEGREEPAFAVVPTRALLPILVVRKKQVTLVHSELRLKVGDQVWVAINTEREAEAFEWLRGHRMVPRDLPSTPRKDPDGDGKPSDGKGQDQPAAAKDDQPGAEPAAAKDEPAADQPAAKSDQ